MKVMTQTEINNCKHIWQAYEWILNVLPALVGAKGGCGAPVAAKIFENLDNRSPTCTFSFSFSSSAK